MSAFNNMKIDYSIIRDIDINKMKEQFVLNEDDIKYDYTPFDNKEIQKYNPIYNIFFNMNESNYDKIGFNHKYQLVDLERYMIMEQKPFYLNLHSSNFHHYLILLNFSSENTI